MTENVMSLFDGGNVGFWFLPRSFAVKEDNIPK